MRKASLRRLVVFLSAKKEDAFFIARGVPNFFILKINFLKSIKTVA